MYQRDRFLATAEARRVAEMTGQQQPWHQWGPYLSERQWGTVREDYSAGGEAWDYFTHDDARSRAYRWGEDGIAGISDNHQQICFALALWNERDPILKERLFGLTGSQGNHGEDVKEYYFYLDNTPTHAYMTYQYKYPQAAFPYTDLVETNGRRGRDELEYELLDTGVFHENRYFDVDVAYAKASPTDMLIEITATNCGPEAAPLHLLPTVWCRNTWSWGTPDVECPSLRARVEGTPAIAVSHPESGQYWLYVEEPDELLFTENETNNEHFGWGPNRTPYVKDAFHRYVVNGDRAAVNPEQCGTKAAAHYAMVLQPGETRTVRLRLSDAEHLESPFGVSFGTGLHTRQREADDFYGALEVIEMPDEVAPIRRQAFAGMLWSKQYYLYPVKEWLDGDPAGPPPPPERRTGRNAEWTHMYNADIFSMPDKWEYPWYAAWDLAFHAVTFAYIDPHFAKRQLMLLTREWYMHPNGQLPAYEWAFGDVNPAVHAIAAMRVYQIEEQYYGHADTEFLKRTFNRMLEYFTWWANRKDVDGKNVFQGGFLGMDNISLFDRSNLSMAGAEMSQADGTSWMAMFCGAMLRMALELSKTDSEYQDWVGKFLQHFLLIADAMNTIGGEVNLWDEEDGFYYDVLSVDGHATPLKVRTMVGLVPLFATAVIEANLVREAFAGAESRSLFTDLRAYMQWFVRHRPDLTKNENISVASAGGEITSVKPSGTLVGEGTRSIMLSLLTPDRLRRVLSRMLDEDEFLSPYGIRSLSKYHEAHPVCVSLGGVESAITYEPAESSSGMFGGNSNWRGPIWFPVNYLIVQALFNFYRHLGDDFTVECPTGSGTFMNLHDVGTEIARRMVSTFLPDQTGHRPVYGGTEAFQQDPRWNDKVLFYEYFHGDSGAGIGASHQTGWTGLAAAMIQEAGEIRQAQAQREERRKSA
jgi:hypothetical protein